MNNKNHPFFKYFSKSETDIILTECEEIVFKADDIIFKEGSSKFSGLIILKNGEVECYEGKQEKPILGYQSKEFFNLSSILYSKTRTFTTIAVKDTELLYLEKSKIDKLISKDNEIGKILEKLSIDDYNSSKLFEIFRNLYGEKMNFHAHKQIYNLGEWVFLEDNSKLFNINDKSDSFYFLVSGLLKAYVPKKDALIEVGEIYEGEVIGEMGIISDEPRSASVFATRDSLVFKLDLKVANELIMKYPMVLLQVATKIADRLRKTQLRNEDIQYRTDIFSLVQLSSGKNYYDDVVQIGNSLVKSINKINPCLVLTSDLVSNMLSIDNINNELKKDKYFPPLNDLIENINKENRYLFLCCDEE